MVLTYKNFLIVERKDPILNAINLAHQLRAWFHDENRIWHVKSDKDKVFLIYQEPFRTDDGVKEYKNNNEVDFQPKTCIGFIHLYCQRTNVKVGAYMFKKDVVQSTYWTMFKQYLIQSIKNAGLDKTISTTPCTLYWEKKLCSKQHQIMMEQLGLLSDRNKKTYVFKSEDVQPTWNTSWNNTWNTPTGSLWNNPTWNSTLNTPLTTWNGTLNTSSIPPLWNSTWNTT